MIDHLTTIVVVMAKMAGTTINCALGRAKLSALSSFCNLPIELSQRFSVLWEKCRKFSGGDTSEETPDPIPNSAVKLTSADDSVQSAKVGGCRELFSKRPSILMDRRSFFVHIKADNHPSGTWHFNDSALAASCRISHQVICRPGPLLLICSPQKEFGHTGNSLLTWIRGLLN